MTRPVHHVFLIPGFLGIESLGDVSYFAHVRAVLQQQLASMGVAVEVHAVSSYATSSVRKRASRLLAFIADKTGNADVPIHLIGHSTGGLDARLLCSPGVRLDSTHDVSTIATRVRSIVTIACPHRGTPLASFFTTRFGAQLLRLLSLGTVYVLRFGRLPISVVVRMAALFVRLHTRISRIEDTIANQMFEQLLGEFSEERRDELTALFKDMAHNQALMAQLMPESMDVFDATVTAHPGIRCGSVVSGVIAEPLASAWRLGLDPYAQATHALFEALRRLTSEMETVYLSRLTTADQASLERKLGRVPTVADNDGIVPVLSQVWGELIHVTRADHFDVIGHFPEPGRTPAHYDWLATGCDFDRNRFDALWTDVARFILDADNER